MVTNKTQYLFDEVLYKKIRFDFFRFLEEEKGEPKLKPYVDSRNIVTIGIGFNIETVSLNFDIVLDVMRLSNKPRNVEFKNKLKNIIKDTIWTNKKDDELQAELDKVMAEWKKVVPELDRDTFSFNGIEETKNAFLKVVDGYESNLDTRLSNRNIILTKPGERLALLSLEYAGILVNSDNLFTALKNQDRVWAWFEIRYKSNDSQEPGFAKRRFYESQMFGLYSDPNNVGETEAKKVIDFLNGVSINPTYTTRNKTTIVTATNLDYILAYENDFFLQAKTAVDEYDLPGNYAQLSIGNIFRPIAKYLIEDKTGLTQQAINDLGIEITGEALLGLETQWTAATPGTNTSDLTPNIQPLYREFYNVSPDNPFDDDLAKYHITGINDLLIAVKNKTNYLAGLYGNDVLIGADASDYLYGGYQTEDIRTNKDTGNDYLFGLGGDDHLYGHKGNDYLAGGEGNDTYYFNYGDDFDTLVDTHGINTLKIAHVPAATPHYESVGVLTQRFKDSHIYMELDPATGKPRNNTTYTLDGNDLFIAVDGGKGGTIRIENFDPALFGITLNAVDAPVYVSDSTPVDFLQASDERYGYMPLGKFSTDSFNKRAIFLGSKEELVDNPDGTRTRTRYTAVTTFSLTDSYSTCTETSSGFECTDIVSTKISVQLLHLVDGLWKPKGSESHSYDTDPTLAFSLIQANTNGYTVTDNGTSIDTTWRQSNPVFYDGSLAYTRVMASTPGLYNPEVGLVFSGTSFNDQLLGHSGIDLFSGNAGDDYIDGREGDDDLYGGLGSDIIHGGAGHDTLWANQSPYNYIRKESSALVFGSYYETADTKNYLFGGTGDDYLIGEAGEDHLSGDADNDVLLGNGGDDFIQGGSGQDIAFGDGFIQYLYKKPKILGSQHHEFLTVDKLGNYNYRNHEEYGNDTMEGGDGDDVLYGEAGHDTIYGGNDNDIIWGDRINAVGAYTANLTNEQLVEFKSRYVDLAVNLHGNDLLYGGDGNDFIFGNGGNDTLFGGAGENHLWGDDYGLNAADHGDDFINGGDDKDIVYGGAGKDTITGGDGDDYLNGEGVAINIAGAVNYTVEASEHDDDTLYGGKGDDTIVGDGGNDHLYGGADADVLHGDSRYTNSQGDTYIFDQTYHGDDYLYGEGGNDMLHGNGGNDFLSGGSGSDYIYGNEGEDILHGDQGNDFLYGNEENDVLIGGTGNDSLSGGMGDDQYAFSLGDGQDTIEDISGALTLEFSTTSHEVIYIERAGDITTIHYSTGDFVTLANDAYDRIVSLQINGTTYSLSDFGINVKAITSASTYGGSGDDTFHVASHNSYGTLVGGAGNDSYIFSHTSTDNQVLTIDDADGVNHIYLGLNSLASINLINADQVSFQTASGQVMTVNVSLGNSRFYSGTDTGSLIENLGDSAVNTLYGFENADQLIGGDYQDYLYGFGGQDVLEGGAGADFLYGGTDDDHLVGGHGNDLLEGGSGADHYVYHKGDGSDVIVEALESDTSDTLSLLGGINPADIYLSRSVDANDLQDLTITLHGSGETITVKNYFAAENSTRLEKIIFSDATVWSDSDILQQLLQSSAGDDQIYGYHTDDTISGGEGSDVIYGRDGNDRLQGDLGKDALNGEAGDDLLDGGAGDDHLDGGMGNDILIGGSGNDSLSDDHGMNIFDGGFGDDTIYNQSTDTVRYGVGDGFDQMYIGTIELKDYNHSQAINSLRFGTSLVINYGDSANDALRVRHYFSASASDQQSMKLQLNDSNVVTDFSTTGVYLNAVFLGALTPEVIDIYWAGATYSPNADQFGQYAKIQTSSSEPSFFLGGSQIGNDLLIGANGDDTLKGHAGNDRLIGGKGNDLLEGGGGDDVLIGGLGNDTFTYYGSDTGVDTIVYQLGDGNDEIQLQGNETRLLLQGGIQNSDIDIQKDGVDLNLYFAATDHTITLYRFFNASGYYEVSSRYDHFMVEFDNGGDLNADQLSHWAKANANNTPVAVRDDLQMYMDSVLVISFDELLRNDIDADNDILSIVDIDNVMNGEIIIDDEARTLTFTPATGYLGTTGFEYTVSDGSATSSTNVSITVSDPDAAPEIYVVAEDVTEESVSVGEVVAEFMSSSMDGSVLSHTLLNNENGYLQLLENQVVLTQTGVDAINNDVLALNAIEVTVQVTAGGKSVSDTDMTGIYRINDNAPVVQGDYTQISQGDTLVVSFDSLLSNASDLDGDELRIVNAEPFGGGLIIDWSAGTIVFTSDNNYSGSAGFTFIVSDDSYTTTAFYSIDIIAAYEDYDSIIDGDEQDNTVTGSEDRDLLRGHDGNDTIFGVNGDDLLQGGEGDDQLYGGNGHGDSVDGNDILEGGAGDDKLFGEQGNDMLIGGSGNDHYIYSEQGGLDTVQDSESGLDAVFFNNIEESRLSFHRDGNHLLILVDGDFGQQVKIANHFLGGDHEIAYIQPFNGDAIFTDQIESRLTPLPFEFAPEGYALDNQQLLISDQAFVSDAVDHLINAIAGFEDKSVIDMQILPESNYVYTNFLADSSFRA